MSTNRSIVSWFFVRQKSLYFWPIFYQHTLALIPACHTPHCPLEEVVLAHPGSLFYPKQHTLPLWSGRISTTKPLRGVGRGLTVATNPALPPNKSAILFCVWDQTGNHRQFVQTQTGVFRSGSIGTACLIPQESWLNTLQYRHTMVSWGEENSQKYCICGILGFDSSSHSMLWIVLYLDYSVLRLDSSIVDLEVVLIRSTLMFSL